MPSTSQTTITLGTISLRDFCNCPDPPCPRCCQCCEDNPPPSTLHASLLSVVPACIIVLDNDELTFRSAEEDWYGETDFLLDFEPPSTGQPGTATMLYRCPDVGSVEFIFTITSFPDDPTIEGEHEAVFVSLDCDPHDAEFALEFGGCDYGVSVTE